MAKAKHTFDPGKSHALISSQEQDMQGVAYMQDGGYFDSNGKFVKEIPGWSKKVADEAKAKEAAIAAKKADEDAKLAEDVLGGLDGLDPQAEAAKENAAAAAAEDAADA